MRTFFHKIITASIFGLTATAIAGQQSTTQQPGEVRVSPDEIRKLVQRLGSDNAKEREAASKALLKIGDDALPRLEVAVEDAGNLELKRRAQALYAEIFAAAPSPKLPEGVIHVKLPPGEVRKETVFRDGKPILRVSVGKTVIEARTLFFGDRYGAAQYEAHKDGVPWMSGNGGKGTIFGSIVSAPGSATFDEAFVPLHNLKPGSLFVTTPSLVFRWGKDELQKALDQRKKGTGIEQPKKDAKVLNLPEGVIHVAMPAGTSRRENIVRDGKPLIRLTVGKAVIEAKSIFLGDAKGATQYEAIEEGMHWVPAKGGKGVVTNGSVTEEPGTSTNDEDFVPLHRLRAGSLFITTPSHIFRWGIEARRAWMNRIGGVYRIRDDK